MTIRDLQFSFSDTTVGAPASLINSTGTFLFPNSIDTSPLNAAMSELSASDTTLSANSNTYRELGGGERMWLVVDITTAVVGATSTTTFSLITSASSALGSANTLYTSAAFTPAQLAVGRPIIVALPRTTAWLQYLGLQYVIGTAALSAGAAVAWIGWDVDAVNLGGASGYGIK